MSYFNNDHLQINNIIVDFEENITKISNFSQVLQSIDNIDEFNDLRNQINNLFSDIENDTSTLINTLKIIQYNNRKIYDDLALLQNNNENLQEKLKMIIKDNSLLLNKNKEINEHINYKNQIINTQEKYIQKLTDIIQKNEKLMNDSKSGNIIKYQNYQKTQNNINEQNNYNINMLKNNKKLIENKSNDNIKKNDNIKRNVNNYLRKNHSFNIPINTLKNIDNNTKREYDLINNNMYNRNMPSVMDNKLNSYINNNTGNNTTKYIFKDDLDEIENESINNNKSNNISNMSKDKIDKVEHIISAIHKNKKLYLKLKEKYGDNFENKIINENANIEFLEHVLNDIYNYSEQGKNNSEKIPLKKRKINLNEIDSQNDNEKYKTYKDNWNNYFKNDDDDDGEDNKLTNYFLFNLHREKMIDNQHSKAFGNNKTSKRF